MLTEDLDYVDLAERWGWQAEFVALDKLMQFVRDITRLWAVEAGWYAGDFIDGVYKNKRSYDSLEEALDGEEVYYLSDHRVSLFIVIELGVVQDMVRVIPPNLTVEMFYNEPAYIVMDFDVNSSLDGVLGQVIARYRALGWTVQEVD